MPVPSSILAKFEANNPRGAVLLSMMDFSQEVLCKTHLGEANLKNTSAGAPFFVHSQEGALLEAQTWASSYQVDRVDFLVVYGIGLGYYYEALRPWLKSTAARRLIFVEDDLCTVRAFLESPCAEAFFDDPQVTLLYLEEGKWKKEVIETIAWNSYKRAWSCIASPSYMRYKNEGFAAFLQELTVCQSEVTDVLQEFFDPGESPLQNFGRNLFLWRKSKNASSLFGRFHNVPAIVVGAGPSLEKVIPQLQALRSKAIIIAGGSAVGALLQAGIIPHFTATVDPNVTQYIRMRQAQPFCLPLMYRSRALHEPLMFHNGPLLYLRGGDGYPLVDYFEHALHVTGPVLEGGHSVSNMIIEIAYALGCRSIIMVGYDLSYVQGDLYAASVSESLGPNEQIAKAGSVEGGIPGHTIDGRVVQTETKWMTEGKWIEQFQKLHPKLHIVQTSKDGLAIDGVEYESFENAVVKHCAHSIDIDALIHLALEEAPDLDVGTDKIAKAIQKLSESLEEVVQVLTLMQEALGRKDFSSERPEWIDLDQRLKATMAYKWVLSPYEAMHAKLAQMQSLLEVRPVDDQKAKERFENYSQRDRNVLLREMTNSYQRFFSAIVSWACMNGIALPDALCLASYKEGAALPKKFFQEGAR